MQNACEPRKYLTITYGCQMNVRDSEIMAGVLEGAGFIETNELTDADLVVFNTCSVRHSAENKVYGKLGEVLAMKRTNPDLLVAVGGCMAQLDNVRRRLKKQKVDIVFGTHNIHELPNLIEEADATGGRIIKVYDREQQIMEPLPSIRNKGISAFVNIMYGCNNFCSYCIVPYTRGRERSRRPEDIINEINDLAAKGYREVTLLGQNVNSYGRGLDTEIDFSDLLFMLNRLDGIDRIRFTTSHPRDMSDKLIDTIAAGGKICEHIHVAMQSGSNKILQQMNRGYTREHYLDLTRRIRDRIPSCAISTDIIVGFPGETDQDFQDTLDMVQKVRFDAAFTFMYSVRTGTRAAEMEEQVPLEVRRERIKLLNQVQYGIAAEINESLEGSVQEVLVEGPSKTDPSRLSARTRENRIIIFFGEKDLIGRLINVRITKAKTFSLFGELV